MILGLFAKNVGTHDSVQNQNWYKTIIADASTEPVKDPKPPRTIIIKNNIDLSCPKVTGSYVIWWANNAPAIPVKNVAKVKAIILVLLTWTPQASAAILSSLHASIALPNLDFINVSIKKIVIIKKIAFNNGVSPIIVEIPIPSDPPKIAFPLTVKFLAILTNTKPIPNVTIAK